MKDQVGKCAMVLVTPFSRTRHKYVLLSIVPVRGSSIISTCWRILVRRHLLADASREMHKRCAVAAVLRHSSIEALVHAQWYEHNGTGRVVQVEKHRHNGTGTVAQMQW